MPVQQGGRKRRSGPGQCRRGVVKAALAGHLHRLIQPSRGNIQLVELQAGHRPAQIGWPDMQGQPGNIRQLAALVGELCGEVDIVQRRQ